MKDSLDTIYTAVTVSGFKDDSSYLDSISALLKSKSENLDSCLQIIGNLTKENFETDASDSTYWKIFISSIVSIFIFAIGLFINWRKKKIERKRELESIKSVVLNWIRMMASPIETQVRNSRQFAIELRNSDNLHPVRFSYNNLMADKVGSFGLKQLSDVFVLNSIGDDNAKSDDLFNVICQLEYLTRVEKRIADTYQEHQDRIMKLLEDWNAKFKELDSIRTEMFRAVNLNTNHGSFYMLDQFQKIANPWLVKYPNGSTVKQTKELLLNPLMTATIDAIKKNPEDHYAHLMLSKIQELNLIYRQWQVDFEGTAKLFYDFSIRIVSVYNVLVKASTSMQSRPFKNIFGIK